MSLKKIFTSYLTLFLLPGLFLTACGEASSRLPGPVSSASSEGSTSTVTTAASTAVFTPSLNPVTTTAFSTATSKIHIDGITLPVVTTARPEFLTRILATNDGGDTWKSVYADSQHFFHFLKCPATNTCYLDRALVTKDAGQSWTGLALTPENDYQFPVGSLSCPSVNVCFSLGRGYVFTTKNGGKTWSDATSNKKIVVLPELAETYAKVRRGFGDIYSEIGFDLALDCPDENNCIAVGVGARVIVTRDGGESWEFNFGIEDYFSSIDCAGKNVCYAVGVAGLPGSGPRYSKITKTTDGGKTWSIQYSDFVQDRLLSISCPSLDVCFTLGENSNILKTVNGGRNWLLQHSDTSIRFVSISCPDTKTCFAGGYAGILLATRDGGTTWKQQQSNLINSRSQISGISCPTTNTCYSLLEYH